MAVMLCGWEGDRRSGVALTMRHRLSGNPSYGLSDLEKGITYAAQWNAAIYLTYMSC